MRKVQSLLTVVVVALLACPLAAAGEPRPGPIREAIVRHASEQADRLERSMRAAATQPDWVPRSCKGRVCLGAAIGAGVGALYGAAVVDGNRSGGAMGGAFLFAILGAGLGLMGCAK